MNKTIKASLITATGGIISTIIGIVASFGAGQKSIQNEINEVVGNVINITDSDNITINDISDLAENYLQLQNDYATLQLQNDSLVAQNTDYFNQLTEANKKINDIQIQEEQDNEDLQSTIDSLYDVDFQNIVLTLNGIDSSYVDEVVVINNRQYYSIGFLQYLLDNQLVSSDASRLFVGNVQSEERMPVSLFELEPFTDGYITKKNNMEDNYSNIYEEALHIHTIHSDNYDNLIGCAQEYYINYNYSKFAFDIFYAMDADQNTDYEIIIYGDGRQLKTFTINRKSKIEHIEVNIQGVEFLQIVGRHTYEDHIYTDTYYFGITNPYLYP